MKTKTTRNTALALLGLAALSIYILACTAFSPDDTKVLYPAFEPDSHAIGLAVYDREARRSDMLFVPVFYEREGATNSVRPGFLRGQWLADGRNIVVAWTGGNDSGEGLTVAVLPWSGRMPFKVLHVPGAKDVAAAFATPLCLAGKQVFMAASGEAIRLDLRTGALTRHEFTGAGEVSLYPAADGAGVFYVEQTRAEQKVVFGRLNPDTFDRTPVMVITNEVADGSFFTYDQNGRTVAFLEKTGEGKRLVVLREGKLVYTRALGEQGEGLVCGSAAFSPKGDRLWAACQRRGKAGGKASYGLMEIPLGDAPVRQITLITNAPTEDDMDALFFQLSLSHDGKTAALASTYLAASQPLQAEECALFLVSLSDPERKVTRVPLAMPGKAPVFNKF